MDLSRAAGHSRFCSAESADLLHPTTTQMHPAWLPQDAAVTAFTGLSILMAGETASLIQLRLKTMPSVHERVDRVVTARSLVVTPFTAVGLMAHSTVHALHRRHSPVEVV